MNLYIINEDELKSSVNVLRKSGHAPMAVMLDGLVRSRPYNPQAEPVGTDGLTDSEYEHMKLVQEIEILHDKIQSKRDKVLEELATFLNNADNTSDSGNAQKWVSLPVLFKWMQSKGWQP